MKILFCGIGDYYCINGCCQYPLDMNAIICFLNELPGLTNFDEITYYDIHPNLFSFEAAMNNEYPVIKGDLSLLSIKTLMKMDFHYFDVSCQLQIELFDDSYYGLALIYNYEDRVSKEFDSLLKETFYRTLKPLYGNDGHEKGVFSLNQLDKVDFDLFNNNFYICDNIHIKMKKPVNAIIRGKPIKGCGIYYIKGDVTKTKAFFYAFIKTIRKEILRRC